MKSQDGHINYNIFSFNFWWFCAQNPPKKSFSMPSNAVCPMPSAFGIGLISNAVGIADAVTSIAGMHPGTEFIHTSEHVFLHCIEIKRTQIIDIRSIPFVLLLTNWRFCIKVFDTVLINMRRKSYAFYKKIFKHFYYFFREYWNAIFRSY